MNNNINYVALGKKIKEKCLTKYKICSILEKQ